MIFYILYSPKLHTPTSILNMEFTRANTKYIIIDVGCIL